MGQWLIRVSDVDLVATLVHTYVYTDMRICVCVYLYILYRQYAKNFGGKFFYQIWRLLHDQFIYLPFLLP